MPPAAKFNQIRISDQSRKSECQSQKCSDETAEMDLRVGDRKMGSAARLGPLMLTRLVLLVSLAPSAAGRQQRHRQERRHINVSVVEDADDGCVCSAFSGNPDGCCTDKGGHETCHTWFTDEPCGTGTRGKYCCNSDFTSKCCDVNACTGGCRNSLQGSCDCKAQQSFEAVGFNESLAVRSLAFNAASQCDAAALRAWACAACPNSTRLVDVNITDAEGHVAYAGYDAARDAVVVVFRGSLSVQDWIDNLDILKVAAYAELGCVGCFVHEGFLKAYEALAPGVAASVTALLARYPGRGVALTGHSLGAAMAAHYALRLRLVDNVTLAGPVYTFGQPRVGDAAFAAWHSALFPAWFRVVHWNDPVPHLPPSDVGFAHEAREIWYDEPSDDLPWPFHALPPTFTLPLTFHRSSPTFHRSSTDLSPTSHRPSADLSPTFHRPSTDLPLALD